MPMKPNANGRRYPQGVPTRFLFNVKRMRRDMRNEGLTVAMLTARVLENGETISAGTVANFLCGYFQTDKTNGKLARALHKRPSRYVLEAEE